MISTQALPGSQTGQTEEKTYDFRQCRFQRAAYGSKRRHPVFCDCVYHVAELVEQDGERLAPCGHAVEPGTYMVLSADEARREYCAKDINRWREAVRLQLSRTSPSALRRRFTPDVLRRGITPSTPFGAAYFALWTVEGPDGAAAFVESVISSLTACWPNVQRDPDLCELETTV